MNLDNLIVGVEWKNLNLRYFYWKYQKMSTNWVPTY